MSDANDLDPVAVACRLAEALETAGLPFAIGGAMAYGFWGVPRGTLDVDLNVFVPAERVDEVLAALDSAGCRVDANEARRSATERGDLRAWLGPVRVDVFLDSIPIHHTARERTVQVELAGHKLPILSAEDLLVFKLLFDRPKDRLDAERILASRMEELDLDYVRSNLEDTVGPDDRRIAWLEELLTTLTTDRQT